MQGTCDKCPEGTSTFNNTGITGATFCLGMSPLQFAFMLFNPKENSGSYKLYLCSCEPNIDLHDISLPVECADGWWGPLCEPNIHDISLPVECSDGQWGTLC